MRMQLCWGPKSGSVATTRSSFKACFGARVVLTAVRSVVLVLHLALIPCFLSKVLSRRFRLQANGGVPALLCLRTHSIEHVETSRLLHDVQKVYVLTKINSKLKHETLDFTLWIESDTQKSRSPRARRTGVHTQPVVPWHA